MGNPSFSELRALDSNDKDKQREKNSVDQRRTMKPISETPQNRVPIEEIREKIEEHESPFKKRVWKSASWGSSALEMEGFQRV